MPAGPAHPAPADDAGSATDVPHLVSGDPMFMFDAKLRVRAWNAAMEQLTGVSRAEAIGRPCWELIDGVAEDGTVVCSRMCPIASTMAAGGLVTSLTMRIRTRRGRRRVTVSTLRTAAEDPPGDALFAHVFLPSGEEDEAPQREAAPEARLTARQLEILRLLAAGMSTEEIVRSLYLSEATVRNHIRAILHRLGSHSRLEAVARARRFGLI
jgi:PAS domain S-box-containing protein